MQLPGNSGASSTRSSARHASRPGRVLRKCTNAPEPPGAEADDRRGRLQHLGQGSLPGTGTGPGAPSVVVSGTSMREFPVPAAHGMGFLRWTSDGSGVGIILADETNKWFLHQLNVASGTWKKIPVPVEMNAHFDWSASGNAILLAKPGPVEKGGGIVEFNLETGAERYVYRPKKEFVSVFRWLDSSRDNKRLAFLQVNSSASALELIVVNLETGESHTAAPDFGYSSWSPDGRKIIGDRALSPKGSKQSLFTVPEAGGPVKEINLGKRLPPRTEIRTPDCSPDGKTIIFTLRSSISEVSLFQRDAAMIPF